MNDFGAFHELGRRAVGGELKSSNFRQAVSNLREAERGPAGSDRTGPDLIDPAEFEERADGPAG